MTLFGPLVHSGKVEQAVQDTLQTWMPTYLREVERQHDRAQGSLPSPRSYRLVSESTDPVRWPEDQLPSLVILCPGFAEPPRHQGSGRYRVTYGVSVAALVSAKDQGATRLLARLYGIAVAAILLQKPSLSNFACGTTWVDERFDDIPSDTQRSIACALEAFTIEADNIIDTSQGPLTEDDTEQEESPEWADIEEVIVDTDTLED